MIIVCSSPGRQAIQVVVVLKLELDFSAAANTAMTRDRINELSHGHLKLAMYTMSRYYLQFASHDSDTSD